MERIKLYVYKNGDLFCEVVGLVEDVKHEKEYFLSKGYKIEEEKVE